MATDHLPGPLAEIVQALLERRSQSVTVDELAEAIGDRAVTPPQIDEMMRRLESAGCTVEQSGQRDLVGLLRDVLTTARVLQHQGESATSHAIATRLQVSASSVHAALLFSKTLKS